MYVTDLGGVKPAQTNAGGGGEGLVSLLQNRTVGPHTLRQNLGLAQKHTRSPAKPGF